MPKYALHVRGHRKEWSFTVPAEPVHVAEWRADGLRVDEVVNEVPQIVQQLGLVDAWCAVEDGLAEVKRLMALRR